MPRKPKNEPIQCQYYSWHLRQKRSGIYFADGRHNQGADLGKYSLSTKDKKEAINRIHELDRHYAFERGKASQDDFQEDNLTIKEGWQLYLERCEQAELLRGASPNTLKRYKAVYTKHKEFCAQKGHKYWSDITKKVTENYGVWLTKKKKAYATVVLELNLICSIANWLVEQKKLSESCRFHIKLSKPDGSSTYCYSKQEVTRIIQYCNDDPSLQWLARVITALATTGLRINELAGLRWSDIDLNSSTIKITDESFYPRNKQKGQLRRTKSKRDRVIPMHPEFSKVILLTPKHQDGVIFRAQKGGRIRDRQTLATLKDKVIKNLDSEFPSPTEGKGFSHGTIHGLRHYFCSEAYRNGATDAELLEWLGHTDSKV
ncbi:MAG: hypothetical protein COA78_34960, partial [Blastopirellula sp.]